MKARFFLILGFWGCVLNASAQHAAPGIFKEVFIRNDKAGKTLCFTVYREVNVRYYRLEAGRDSTETEIVNTIPSAGNSVMPCSYRLPLNGFGYPWYRVCLVDMNGSLSYSPLISPTVNLTKPVEIPVERHINSGDAALR